MWAARTGNVGAWKAKISVRYTHMYRYMYRYIFSSYRAVNTLHLVITRQAMYA